MSKNKFWKIAAILILGERITDRCDEGYTATASYKLHKRIVGRAEYAGMICRRALYWLGGIGAGLTTVACGTERSSLDYYQMCIAWSEEDAAFVASMPELPGCMADGQTQAEALGNLCEVAALWIETARQMGREVPQPKHIPVSGART